ncbi:MAG: hypothetical protein RQ729_05995 [Wenzhouxiangellaceae bacterium]|nr:hypothetical protein [Wenzhouxiangellaceae bacterium]
MSDLSLIQRLAERSRMLPRLIVMAVLLILAGCGMFRREEPAYLESEELSPLRVPPGLTPPNTDSVFEIAGYSLPTLAAQGNEALPPRVPTSEEAERARSRIRFGPTGLYLEVDDEAASVWRRLGFAVNRGGMSLDQVLADERRFRVRFEHDPIVVDERGWFSNLFLFWKSPEMINFSGTYLLEVQRETGGTTRVAILDDQGRVLPMERAEFVLNRLQRRLG